jgi:hypothetical protein
MATANPAAPSDQEARAIMDQCVQEAVQAGRSSLHADDPLARFELTTTKAQSPDLQLVLDLLDYAEDRIARDNHKYVLSRNGTTSFVYLAAGGGGVNGLVQAQ